jgi:hypothetical protein
MGYRTDRPEFLVTVDGQIAPDGGWRIEVVVRFKRPVRPRRDRTIIDDATAAFFRGVLESEALGRTQGATRGHVHVEGDAEIIGAARDVELSSLGIPGWKPGDPWRV